MTNNAGAVGASCIPDITQGSTTLDLGSLPHIQYCLSQRVQEKCRLRTSMPILLAVIVANAVKVICILVTLLDGEGAVVTLGDTISCFIRNPDRKTQKVTTASRNDPFKVLQDARSGQDRPSTHGNFHYQAVPAPQWLLCNGWSVIAA